MNIRLFTEGLRIAADCVIAPPFKEWLTRNYSDAVVGSLRSFLTAHWDHKPFFCKSLEIHPPTGRFMEKPFVGMYTMSPNRFAVIILCNSNWDAKLELRSLLQKHAQMRERRGSGLWIITPGTRWLAGWANKILWNQL